MKKRIFGIFAATLLTVGMVTPANAAVVNFGSCKMTVNSGALSTSSYTNCAWTQARVTTISATGIKSYGYGKRAKYSKTGSVPSGTKYGSHGKGSPRSGVWYPA